jgi:hypothetical protein
MVLGVAQEKSLFLAVRVALAVHMAAAGQGR